MEADQHPCQLVEKYMATTSESFDILVNNVNAWLEGRGILIPQVTGLQGNVMPYLMQPSALSDSQGPGELHVSGGRRSRHVTSAVLPYGQTN